VPVAPGHEQKNWSSYGNTGGTRFAALDQITRDNVQQLEVAWTFHTGDTPISPTGNGAEDQQTPLQIGDRVYLCTPHNNVIAVDADSGKKIWERDINAQSQVWNRCRGLAYFDATQPLAQPPGRRHAGAACRRAGRRQLPAPPADEYHRCRLVAIDADTGAMCEGFGNGGFVDLKAGLGNAEDPKYQLTSAPTWPVRRSWSAAAWRTTCRPTCRAASCAASTSSPARCAGLRSGPRRSERAPRAGQDLCPQHAEFVGADVVRRAMNTVFIPMGSSSVDLWGGNRTPLDHRYATSILALDATTGKEKWVYQTVHNDLWDFDVPMQPSLLDFPGKDGKTTPAVVFGSKSGQIFVLDRLTGKPITRVEERPVKTAGITGEQYSLTQPFSVGMPQIGADTLTESDMWGATPFDQLMCRISFKSMRYEGLFTAPGTDVSLSFPGSLGGMNWGSLSTDPNHHVIFVNDMRLGLWVQMIPQKTDSGPASNGGEAVNTGMGAVPLKGTPYAVNKNRFMSPLGIPCQKPPFGTLSAVDLKTQKILWQVPVGTVQDTGPFGIKMRVKMPVGMPTLGGTLATQGGLVFIAGTQDYYLRAFDSATGKEVWKARLPVGSQGGPMSYVSPKTGKQYVLISAGGARQSPDRGDYVIAYALK
jgi:quinate dehydrogenase (quinone)